MRYIAELGKLHNAWYLLHNPALAAPVSQYCWYCSVTSEDSISVAGSSESLLHSWGRKLMRPRCSSGLVPLHVHHLFTVGISSHGEGRSVREEAEMWGPDTPHFPLTLLSRASHVAQPEVRWWRNILCFSWEDLQATVGGRQGAVRNCHEQYDLPRVTWSMFYF